MPVEEAHDMHTRITRSDNEAIILAVTTRAEQHGPRKKRADQLDEDMRIECVLWIKLISPMGGSAPVFT